MPGPKQAGSLPKRNLPEAVVTNGEPNAVEGPSRDQLLELAANDPFFQLRGLHAGYGKMEVLHDLDLVVGRGQSLCIVGPNGAGKSTLMHAVFGLADIFAGRVEIGGRDVTGASVNAMSMQSKAVYVLQSSSIFPDMTVEENLFMGGILLGSRRRIRDAVERIFDSNQVLAQHRHDPAGVLSGGERRLLELSRALMMEPEIIFVDEPSIGLEPKAVQAVFDLLETLQKKEGKTIILIEQNVKKGLEFADIGYVFVSGHLAMADDAASMLENPRVGHLFLGR